MPAFKSILIISLVAMTMAATEDDALNFSNGFFKAYSAENCLGKESLNDLAAVITPMEDVKVSPEAIKEDSSSILGLLSFFNEEVRDCKVPELTEDFDTVFSDDDIKDPAHYIEKEVTAHPFSVARDFGVMNKNLHSGDYESAGKHAGFLLQDFAGRRSDNDVVKEMMEGRGIKDLGHLIHP